MKNGKEWVDNYLQLYNIVDVEKLVDNPISEFKGNLDDLDDQDVKVGDEFTKGSKKWTAFRRDDEFGTVTFTICDEEGNAMSNLSVKTLNGMKRSKRIAMTAKNIIFGWMVLDIKDLYDVTSDGDCIKNWREAAKIVVDYNSLMNCYVAVNMNGESSYLRYDCTDNLALIWQHDEAPFNEYVMVLAAGDCMEYYRPIPGDVVGQCTWDDDDDRKLETIELLSVSNRGKLQLTDLSNGSMSDTTIEDLKHYAIINRTLVVDKILNNEFLDVDEFGRSDEFDDFYGFKDGHWQLTDFRVGDRKDVYTIN